MQHAQKTISNTSEQTDANRIVAFAEALVASQGGYLADSLYSFKSENNKVSLELISTDKQPSLRWLILGREHYFETVKEYPIANKNDVKQAILFDDTIAPFEGIRLHLIERINEQSHRVTFWVFNKEILEKLTNRPWLILPETYILSQVLTPNNILASIETQNKTLFMYHSPQGVLSGIKKAHMLTLEDFALSSGAPFDFKNNQQVTIVNEEFPELLRKGIKSSPLSNLQGFFIKSEKIQWQNYPWKTAGLLCASVLAGYLAITSVWLIVQQEMLDNKLAAQSGTVNQALAMQKKYQNQIKFYQDLLIPLEEQQPYWNVWRMVLDSVSIGSTIDGVHFKNNKITIQGTTSENVKATDILAKLSESPYATLASFSKPVRQNKGKEEFSIEFSFAPAITVEQSNNTNSKKNIVVKGASNATSN